MIQAAVSGVPFHVLKSTHLYLNLSPVSNLTAFTIGPPLTND